MNEDIKKIEISEDELENVAGGAESAASITCPMCKGKMVGTAGAQGKEGNYPKYICLACKHGVW